MTGDKLIFLAGNRALETIRTQGLAPSESFVSSLPNGKITDRKDFYRYAGNDEGRFACWHQVANAGKRLADDFMEAVESGSIRRRVKPLDCIAR